MKTETILLAAFGCLAGVIGIAAIATHVFEARLTWRKEQAKRVQDEEKARLAESHGQKIGSPSTKSPLVSSSSSSSSMRPMILQSQARIPPPRYQLDTSPARNEQLQPAEPVLHIRSPISACPTLSPSAFPSPSVASPRSAYSPTTPLTPYTSTGVFAPTKPTTTNGAADKGAAQPFLPVRSYSTRPAAFANDRFTAPPPPMNLSRVRQYTTPPRGLRRSPMVGSGAGIGLGASPAMRCALGAVVPAPESALEREGERRTSSPHLIIARSVSELVGKPEAAAARREEYAVRREARGGVKNTERNMGEVGRLGW